MKPVTSDQAVTPKELQNFGLIMAAMLILMFVIVLPWLFSYQAPWWPWVAALLFASTALVLPTLLRPVYYAWLKLGNVLGWVNTHIIMGVIYFLVLLPIGLVMRALGKNPLPKQPSVTHTSYRIVTKNRDKKHLERPF